MSLPLLGINHFKLKTSIVYKLLEGDSTFREKDEKEIVANKRFATLFPKPIKSGWFIFGKLEYPKLTREQIKEILVKNHLVREGADVETATHEALKRDYDIETYGDTYVFVGMTNGNGHKAYEFQLRRHLLANI